MKWIEYDYVCNENKGIKLHKKVEYNKENLAIARQEAVNGNYTITEDDEVAGLQPLAIELGGTNAKTTEEACKNVGGINTYTHSSNGLTGMGVNGKFKATISGTFSVIKVNGVNHIIRCGEDTSIDLVAGCWYTFILDGDVVNFSSGGAGVGLNFKVVGGTTVPASPKENMLWVKSETPVASYAFSPTEQVDPADGAVWFFTGISSPVSLNILKKNVVNVFLVSCRQFISGEWMNVEAYIYQGGKWKQFSSLIVYLYDNGVTSLEWVGQGTDTADALVMKVFHANYGGSYSSEGWKSSATAVTVPHGMKKLCMRYSVSFSEGSPDSLAYAYFGLSNNAYTSYPYTGTSEFAAYLAIAKSGSDIIVELPITDALYGNEYYVCLKTGTGSSNIDVTSNWTIAEIWFE